MYRAVYSYRRTITRSTENNQLNHYLIFFYSITSNVSIIVSVSLDSFSYKNFCNGIVGCCQILFQNSNLGIGQSQIRILKQILFQNSYHKIYLRGNKIDQSKGDKIQNQVDRFL